ncbi:hypothetical protein THRCLA_03870 [Thraustotheca clavata]|uniref:Endonuclease/exonuclease/phosphatase domain-containing protein n=1 Tax=Thraustotheca clavata TaxID=74557 RepID=A0A1W0A0P1_9STRA|nr:hypothetical protein THRCLA_03870 [Thraustotheca clavata]
MAVRLVPIEESKDAAGPRFSLMSFNVLAQCYVRSAFFPYCDKRFLKWKTRSLLLKGQMASMHPSPDIVCFQECDHYEDFWKEMMANLDYSGVYMKKSGSKSDGVAIFWLHDRLEMTGFEQVELKNAIGDLELAQRLEEMANVGLIASFKSKYDVDVPNFSVATTHLFWDPAQADVKLSQATYLLETMQLYIKSNPYPMFLAGDFNSLPESPVYSAILGNGLRASAYTAQGNGEPAFTNCNGIDKDGKPAFVGTLDYIFYEPQNVVVTALAPLISYEEATAQTALPNCKFGSDHLPLVAEFAFSGV